MKPADYTDFQVQMDPEALHFILQKSEEHRVSETSPRVVTPQGEVAIATYDEILMSVFHALQQTLTCHPASARIDTSKSPSTEWGVVSQHSTSCAVESRQGLKLAAFVKEHDLKAPLRIAGELVQMHFKTVWDESVYLDEDPETGELWAVLLFNVAGDVDHVSQAHLAFSDDWVDRAPWAARQKIRINYNIV